MSVSRETELERVKPKSLHALTQDFEALYRAVIHARTRRKSFENFLYGTPYVDKYGIRRLGANKLDGKWRQRIDAFAHWVRKEERLSHALTLSYIHARQRYPRQTTHLRRRLFYVLGYRKSLSTSRYE